VGIYRARLLFGVDTKRTSASHSVLLLLLPYILIALNAPARGEPALEEAATQQMPEVVVRPPPPLPRPQARSPSREPKLIRSRTASVRARTPSVRSQTVPVQPQTAVPLLDGVC